MYVILIALKNVYFFTIDCIFAHNEKRESQTDESMALDEIQTMPRYITLIIVLWKQICNHTY